MKVVSENHSAGPADAIAQEAASWVAQLDAGRLSSSDRLALVEWMARSPVHVCELEFAAQLWRGVDITLDEIISSGQSPSLWKAFKSWTVVRPAQFGAALALAICMCALPVMLSQIQAPDAVESVTGTQIYSVAKGELLVQTLPDGSVIHINTDTQVEVHYTEAKRTLRLIRGEAYFDVAHNPDRPFEVFAGGNRVEAVGTAFVVSMALNNNVDVIVTEGKVRVDQLAVKDGVMDTQAAAPSRTVFVPSGHRAEVKVDSYEIASIAPDVIEKEMAWQHGQLIFNGDPLEEVVAQAERYGDLKIVISDPSLRGMPFAGTFSTRDIGLILKAIELYDIDANYVSENLVYLERKASAP